jgi:predicted metal-dependent phosphoesterase TrpH
MTGDRPIRADLHNHTHFSPDSILSPEQLVERCLARKIDCIAVTDHNTIRGGIEVSKIVEARQLEDLTVIVGEEVRSAEGEILGLFLTEDIPRGLSGEETIDRIKSQGGIVGVPHPFDRMRSALDYQRMVALMEQIDFIETFNARIVFKSHNDKARRFATENGLAMSAASDAHSPREIGRAYVEMRPFDGPADFLAALRDGRTAGRISSPLIHMVSRFAVIRRSLGWRPK